MRILAHQAYDIGHHGNCVDLASASVQLGKGRVDHHTQALLLLTLAKAYAMNKERHQAVATIGEAEATLHKARPDDERPLWAGMHGLSPAQFNNHVAKVMIDLGDLKGAEDHFKRSLTHYLNRDTMPRIYALASTWLAEVQCMQGKVELACSTWSEAFKLTEGIQSTRTIEAKNNMRRMLSPYRRRGIPDVNRLLEAA